MSRENLVDATASALIDRVLAGDFADGALPNQEALARECGVSRLTVREAMKGLEQRGVIRVAHGVGTFVVPAEHWRDIDAIARLQRLDPKGTGVSRQLIEVRRMIEIGAAELCAARCPDSVLETLECCVQKMRAAAEDSDVDTFVDADIDFHDTILQGTGNPFVAAIFDPMRPTLEFSRTQTSSVADIREHAIAEHQGVLDAIVARDPEAAGRAMTSHMDQTQRDLETYVLSR
ncbi:FadR/GntR family transcriptional regulator [Propionimicrobium sp. PCR01-08-3]|uniref:FadR/GntR family transcriptional regulator n=1 Tax=Propionimicrobium sp. PCR01-08-3 TaxID=3052086 RepID=UPI00255C4BD9|nr:FadR/GntR family transcriptional regulator [Propionimicrobium sp. PCR01-08-3]WIY82708.1 FadR/GntR family transcriptional regulator [Propionimicrobium sp. PCR01-08-3]